MRAARFPDKVNLMARAFKALPSGPKPEYDAIIIGAGIGGLVCGNLLAKAGMRVLLVEQHYMVGGYCSTFKRKGYIFDAATHFYPLLGNPTTITGRLLVDLGVTNGWVKMDPVDHFHFPDGTTFLVPADFDEYLAKLKVEFPHESQSLDRFFATVREVYLLGLLEYFRWRQTRQLEKWKKLTLRQALDQHFTDRKLKLLLAADCGHWGSPPSRISFVFDSMLRLSYFLGNYYPAGGSQDFADELAQRFEERGGDILMSSMVKQILTENGTATGIDVETGPAKTRTTKRVSAPIVISNADLVLTLEKLLAPGVVDPGYLQSIKNLRPTQPCFLTHIALQGIETEVLRKAEGYHWTSWDSDTVGRNGMIFKVFVPTLFDPSIAPEGGHIVIIQKMVEVDYDGVTDWAVHKEGVEKYILENLERIIPGFSEKIVFKMSASALTSWRYTLNFKGAMLGWEMSPDQLGQLRPNVESPVKNLYYVGHWAQPGGGITPVIVSAMKVAESIIGLRSAYTGPPSRPLVASRAPGED